jgi:hypothetical protein
MSSGKKQNVTYIDDLPELDELEALHGGGHQGQTALEDRPDTTKFIRTAHRPPNESGMVMSHFQEQHAKPYQEPPLQQPPSEMIEQYVSPSFNCIDVANHIKDCPICSRFYNNDKTAYVIAIVFLALICVLLLKKVLEL